jgi:hypothetical protein
MEPYQLHSHTICLAPCRCASAVGPRRRETPRHAEPFGGLGDLQFALWCVLALEGHACGSPPRTDLNRAESVDTAPNGVGKGKRAVATCGFRPRAGCGEGQKVDVPNLLEFKSQVETGRKLAWFPSQQCGGTSPARYTAAIAFFFVGLMGGMLKILLDDVATVRRKREDAATFVTNVLVDQCVDSYRSLSVLGWSRLSSLPFSSVWRGSLL